MTCIRLAAIAALLVSGCAITPEELRTGGTVVVKPSALTPTDAHACLLRRLPELNGAISATERKDATPPEIWSYWIGGLWTIASVRSAAQGSEVTWRFNPILLEFEQNRFLAAMESC